MPPLEDLFECFKPGERLFIPGNSAEPRPLVKALSARAESLPALRVTHSFLPGINPFVLAAADNRITETVLFPQPGHAEVAEKVRLLPLSYYGACRYLHECTFDWVFAHVSIPDNHGRCSLGTSVEFLPAAMAGAGRIVGIINRRMPRLPGAVAVEIDRFHATLEVDWPLVSYDPGEPDEVSQHIARQVAPLVEDGAVLQVGLGRVPASLVRQLTAARRLRLHSGLITAGFRTLSEAGALDPDARHTGGIFLGPADFYRWLDGRADIKVVGVEETHSPGIPLRHAGFTAINSALEVDLSGQANLETLDGKAVSAAGGAPDFSRAARYANRGRNILALPATAAEGKVSRIVPAFPAGQRVALGRHDVDYVVTEFGVAALTGKSTAERARALIDIAAPPHQPALEEALDTQGTQK